MNDGIDEENETIVGDDLGLLHGPRALLRLNFSSLINF